MVTASPNPRRYAYVVALALLLSTLVGAGSGSRAEASPIVTNSTTGVRMVTVPDTNGDVAYAINESNWIALTNSVWPGAGSPVSLLPDAVAVDPGSGGHTINDINASGTVVGRYVNGAGRERSFTWSPGNPFEDIGAPPGYLGFDSLRATGIDDAGTIAGYYRAASTICGGSTTCGFVGTSEALQAIPDVSVIAQGINDGLVVGSGQTWTATGGAVPLQGNGVRGHRDR